MPDDSQHNNGVSHNTQIQGTGGQGRRRHNAKDREKRDGHKGPCSTTAKKTEEEQDTNIGTPRDYYNAPGPSSRSHITMNQRTTTVPSLTPTTTKTEAHTGRGRLQMPNPCTTRLRRAHQAGWASDTGNQDAHSKTASDLRFPCTRQPPERRRLS